MEVPKRDKGKYRSAKQGLFKLTHPEKFIKVLDEYMGSSEHLKDGYVEFKSSLEYKAIRYCDYNPKIIHWSLEPFYIPYVKPKDHKVHRYFIDLFIEFENGVKFLVEVKSFKETIPPVKPLRITEKSLYNFYRACETYSTNKAKWESAKKFCEKRNLNFAILTERELK